MEFTLEQILALVGKLDDSPAPDGPRDRFRTFLKQNVLGVGQIRDYVGECLKTSGTQYDRALQDLVNHIALFLGFEVTIIGPENWGACGITRTGRILRPSAVASTSRSPFCRTRKNAPKSSASSESLRGALMRLCGF
jgi:hypothetical protein